MPGLVLQGQPDYYLAAPAPTWMAQQALSTEVCMLRHATSIERHTSFRFMESQFFAQGVDAVLFASVPQTLRRKFKNPSTSVVRSLPGGQALISISFCFAVSGSDRSFRCWPAPWVNWQGRRRDVGRQLACRRLGLGLSLQSSIIIWPATGVNSMA